MAGKRRYARRMETDAPHHGERMNKLVSAMNKATEKVLSNCTRQAFLECYPTELTSKHREVFTAAHEQFLANLGKNIKVGEPFILSFLIWLIPKRLGRMSCQL